MLYKGGCHCRAIEFEVEAPEEVEAEDCNCSICQMTGFLHLIVPRNRFRLLTGEEFLQTYRFNTGIAQHLFCKQCGIKPFYVPRSNPDGIDVNIRCLDIPPKSVKISPFDGKNWEQNAYQLKHKSSDSAPSQ